ncbi:hypothetical protein AYO20_09354 [Fonsecaea nubica]|uniref:GPI inositol-deacylase n=1 Tax=Fonsecaea nubica TaxID=856822 RepID=A0A178CHR9_9EURO|nr:hypothetical protein AYO20_09354 [Fonsecaea nubica]OAL28874.1 hypothetical protein AYO20_09354 [Fonsecaea nubica]
MISRFRRQERPGSPTSLADPEERAARAKDDVGNDKGSGWPLNHSDTHRSHLSGLDLPLRLGRSQATEARQKQRSNERRADPLGLTVLHEPESSPSVDIVFIHGLGGTSRHTWCSNRDLQLFWPREWLPYEQDLSSTRVMTFGYNAHFSSLSHGNENILNVSDFAKDLLFSLKFAVGNGERNLNIGTVPIIFVAHSMGGLVAKKAFILGQHDEHYHDLIQAVSAIVFLSTPHRGSDLAESLNRILSVCIGLSSREFVSELAKNSQTLQEINEQFRNLASRLSIVSFFETLKTAIGLSRVMVLQKDSSILGYPGEISKPLDADHHDVCKYTSQRDPNYISVRNILKYLVDKFGGKDPAQVDVGSVDELHEIASALGPVQDPVDDLIFFANRRMAGSCDWTHEDPLFASFFKDEAEQPRCIWCTGRPGSEKSVLASSIIQSANESDFGVAYYFFRFGDHIKNNINTLLLSLSHQIAAILPEYRRRLLRLFDDGFNAQKSAPRLVWQKLFTSTLFQVKLSRPLFIIIDGLDECDSAAMLLKLLEDLHLFLAPIRLMVFSRSPQNLSSAFDKLSKRIRTHHHLLEKMADDLRMYAEEEMATMRGDEDFKYEVADKLARKADGNFLWANLVLAEVLQYHTEDEVFKALEEVPDELESLYERMDTKLAKNCRPSDRMMGKTIMMWITCSRHPLTLLDLAEALRPEYTNILDLRYTINRVCGDFVLTDSKGVVSMVHWSARDYLTQNSDLNYHIPRGSSHRIIFSNCIRELASASSKVQSGQIKAQAFLLYAATSWPFHLEQSSEASEVSDQESLVTLARFFQSSAASKKMTSFLKRIDRLDEERNPLTHRLKDKEIVDLWSTDLIRLVGKFGSHLTEQPKLIFRLVAPFCPRESAMYKQFGDRTASSRFSVVSGLSTKCWDDCLAKFTVHNSKSPLQIKCANRYFAILLSDGTIQLYHASTCEEARSFHHGERVLAWCFNAAGDKMVTCGMTKTIVWVTATAQQQRSSSVNHRRLKIQTVTFVNNDQTLFACCDDRTVRRLSLDLPDEGWQVLEDVLGDGSFEGKQLASPRCASFNPSAGGRCLRIVDGHQALRSTTSDVQAVTWNPMTGHVVGIYNDGCLFKWHPFDADYQESNLSIGRVECSPDGKFLVTSSRDGTLRIWDFFHFTPVYQLSYSAPVTSLAIDPNGTRIYDIRECFCSVWEPNTLVRMWETEDRSSDTMSNRESTLISHVSETSFETLQPITALAVEPGSLSYTSGNDDGLVALFSRQGHALCDLLQTFMPVDHICWSANGQFVAAASSTWRRLFVKEVNHSDPTESPRPIMTDREADPIRQILLSPTGGFLLVATDCFLNIWSTHEQRILSSRPQVTLHQWFNFPENSTKIIGFTFASVEVIDWQDAAEAKRMTLDRTLVDASTNQPRHAWMHRRPSSQYPMSPSEAQEGVDKIVLTVDATMALVVTSRSTAQGRYDRQYFFINLSNLMFDYDSTTPVTASPLPPDLQTHMAKPLGFLEADRNSRRRSSAMPLTSTAKATHHTLAFLDHNFWVCTYTMHESNLGRVKRHFFLPRDWINLDWLDLAIMREDGVLLCPRNGEIAFD